MNIQVGDFVQVTCDQATLSKVNVNAQIKPAGVYEVDQVTPVDLHLKLSGIDGDGKGTYVRYTMVTLIPDVPLKVSPKTKPKTKPKIKLMSNGKRQFDVELKLMVVRHVAELRKIKGKAHGNKGIKEYLESMMVNSGHLVYWTKQFNQGHFTSNRAVAFSRQDIMIHG